MAPTPPGGISPREFLRRHWQKELLFTPGALPDAATLLTPRDVIALACREDVESRLVMREGRTWSVQHGPFRRRALAALPAGGWALLVQGVDSHVAQARALMRRFAFVPYARQDDLMVSLAPPGGGVGPHFDSYDVFLLQARGRRRWRLSGQSDLRVVESAPLRILRRFVPDREIVVEPGDLLYLPPQVAHDGIAVDECMTLSVGFRAPSHQELATRFAEWLQDHVVVAGRYSDPDPALPKHPAVIPTAMVSNARSVLNAVLRRPHDVPLFLGCYLTEPKPHVWFPQPAARMSRVSFARRVASRGVALDLRSRMLVHGRLVFMNGTHEPCDARSRDALLALADEGSLPPGAALGPDVVTLLHRWYHAGYLVLP